MTTPSTRFEIAWVTNGRRILSHIALPDDQVQFLEDLSVAVTDGQWSMNDVRGFNFLRLPDHNAPTTISAFELVDVILSAMNIEPANPDYQRFSSLLLAAENLDALVESNYENSIEMGVEFVWDNGGGDDNLFTHHFRSYPSDQEAVFFDSLRKLEGEDDFFYDLIFFKAQEERPDVISLDEMLQVAQSLSGTKPLVDFLLSVQSVDRREKLGNIQGEVKEASLPGPRPKM